MLENQNQEEENKNGKNNLQIFDLKNKLPNLHSAKAIPVDLTSEYWTPEKIGEFKLVFFQEIKISTYTDEQSTETMELPCAVMIEQKENGDLITIRNGSKRLVAAIEDAMKNHVLSQGTPLKVMYLGKQKNATNAFKSDIWSVKPLYVQSVEEKLAELTELYDEKEASIPTKDIKGIKRIIDEKEVSSYDKALAFLRNLEIKEEK